MDRQGLMCLNDWSRTIIDIRSGKESAQDLTVVSSSIARICEWKMLKKSTIGSDHYPNKCKIGMIREENGAERTGRWMYEKAEWDK